jgi:hypothetical protein
MCYLLARSCAKPVMMLCRFEPIRIDHLSCGSINLHTFEQESTGKERMFVPASDRYAVVPGADVPGEVPHCVPLPLPPGSPKRARLV